MKVCENLALGILFLFSSCVSAQGTEINNLTKEELDSIIGTYAFFDLMPDEKLIEDEMSWGLGLLSFNNTIVIDWDDKNPGQLYIRLTISGKYNIVEIEKMGESQFLLFIPTPEHLRSEYSEYMELGIRITDNGEFIFDYEELIVFLGEYEGQTCFEEIFQKLSGPDM